VVRTSQVIGDEIEQGLAWASDKPMTVLLVRDTIDTINAKLRQYVTQGRLIGGKAWYDPRSTPRSSSPQGRPPSTTTSPASPRSKASRSTAA
jgi:phage tail sheath protein FI